MTRLGKVDAVVKQIKQSVNSDNEEFIEEAEPGDIVTINLKQCYFDGKKIEKSDIKTKNASIGLNQNEPCDGFNLIKIKFEKCDDFIEKLKESLEKQNLFPKKQKAQELENNATAHIVSLLWFGKIVPITVVSVNLPENSLNHNIIVDFKLLYNQELPIPKNKNLRNYIKRIIIKDQHRTEQIGREIKGKPKWKYYVGEILFED